MKDIIGNILLTKFPKKVSLKSRDLFKEDGDKHYEHHYLHLYPDKEYYEIMLDGCNSRRCKIRFSTENGKGLYIIFVCIERECELEQKYGGELVLTLNLEPLLQNPDDEIVYNKIIMTFDSLMK